MSNLVDSVANILVEESKSENRDYITGERNLILTKEELLLKIIRYKEGKSYLRVLEAEYKILERQGVIRGFYLNGITYFRIPDWDSLMSRINAFNYVCGPY